MKLSSSIDHNIDLYLPPDLQMHSKRNSQRRDADAPSAKRIKLQPNSLNVEKREELEHEVQTAGSCLLEAFGDIMESELTCSICAELFISATTLNCSHTFCKYCITMWRRHKNQCPICRAAITAECNSLVIDSFIEKAVDLLPEKITQKRKDIVRSRTDEVIQMNMTARKIRTTTTRRRARRNRRN
ncbi:E3 ubiquitin-protein ligase RNF8-like [Maniola hyperantus]|uniref:E3 ubiquitin-protein ligase RNF8-like n=1 Tax=Aphantopus hyperantus TaxID=2795564 RepID=UPI003749881A